MRDLALWEALRAGERPADLVEQLRLLGEERRSQRLAFVGFAARLAREDPEPEVRAAAISVLAGVRGVRGVRTIVSALDDEAADVRLAAVGALAETAREAPLRWVHVTFHPRPDVRAQSLELAPQGARSLGTYLRADPACAEAARRAPWPGDDLGLALDLYLRGLATADEAAAQTVGIPVPKIREFLDLSLRRSMDQAAAFLEAAVVGSTLPQPDGQDILDLLCRVVLSSSQHRAAGLRLLADAALSGEGKALRPRLAVSLLVEGAMRPGAVSLAIACAPTLLTAPGLDRTLRRGAAVDLLERTVTAKLPREAVLQILEAGLVRTGEAPDLEVAAGIVSLAPDRWIATLADHLGEDALVDAVARDVRGWRALCRLPAEPKKSATWLLSLVWIRHPTRMPATAAVALCAWVGPHPEAFENTLKALHAKEALATALALVHLADTGTLAPHEKGRSRVVRALLDRVAAPDRGEVLVAALQDPEPSPTSVAAIQELVRLWPARELSFAAGPLPPDLLWRLLQLFDGKLALPRGHEVVLAKTVAGHADERIREWSVSVLGPSRPPAPRPVPVEGVHDLRPAEMDRIATCLEADLDEALLPALRGPTRGLAAALARRPDPFGPNLSVAVALLGCTDDLAGVATQLDRFSDDSEWFDDTLRSAAVTVWQGRAGLPVLANAWLHCWERHGLEVGAWLDASPGKAAGALQGALELPCGLVRRQLWAAAASLIQLRRYREPVALEPLASDGLVELCVTALDTEVGPAAAKILVALLKAGLCGGALAHHRSRALSMMPDLDRVTRHELDRWIRVDETPIRSSPARRLFARLTSAEVREIRRSTDLDALEAICRRASPKLVHEAALRLIELGEPGETRLVALLSVTPALDCVPTLVESIALWSSPSCIADVRALATDPETPPDLRFRLACALLERGEEDCLEPALALATEPTDDLWLGGPDWDRLCKHAGEPAMPRIAAALCTAPHPHAYTRAVDWLVARPVEDPTVLDPLLAFLQQGTRRPTRLRRAAATRLLHHGRIQGLPVLLQRVADEDEAVDWLMAGLGEAATETVVETLTDACLLGGKPVCPEGRVVAVIETLRRSDPTRTHAEEQILIDGVDRQARARIVALRGTTPARYSKLANVAQIFAWGVRRGRELTGRLFSVHMTGARGEFGHTRLDGNRVNVTPLPVLRGDRNGADVVEALILHEIGHHMYHRGRAAGRVWKRASKEGLFPLLNLVADEHLERNIRAIDGEFGDRLKRLAAYAFQHARREIMVERLLGMLRGASFEVLSAIPLGVAFSEDAVDVQSGTLLRELDAQGNPFARFVRALRMGLGDRHGDPRVRAGLELFGSTFRHSNMQELYEVTRKLADLYGGAAEIAKVFGGHEGLEWDERDAAIHGEGIDDEAVQREVERILDPRQLKRGAGGHGKPGGPLQINVTGEERYDPITTIQPVTPDKSLHRELARETRRHSTRLREYLARLGLALVPRRGRLRGRAFDRTRARAVVTRRDPRMLIARETEIHSDLFVGVIVDCSGSMNIGDSMDKARRFGVLIAEAVRDLPGVDARFFGFTDTVIYDAGDAQLCAVSSLEPNGGNNDAAALDYVARVAARSRRKAKLLVMISDGLPTECSAQALRNLAYHLTRRRGMICAQVAVRPLDEQCFPHYVVVDDENLDTSVRRFGEIVSGLARRALGR